MPDFWENGLQGSLGGVAWPASSGISQPGISVLLTAENMDGAAICGSFSLNTGAEIGRPYTILLNSFSTGAQIYLEFTPRSFTSTLYLNDTFPAVPCSAVFHDMTSCYIKKGNEKFYCVAGSNQNTDSYLTAVGSTLQDNLFTIYGWNYWKSQPLGMAYQVRPWPRDGQSGGNTHQFACVKRNGRLEFYRLGFAIDAGPYPGSEDVFRFDAPCAFAFAIPANLLNNPALFDPEQDGYTPSQDSGTGAGGGGNVPDLPIAPTYPGTDIDFPSLPTGANAFGFSRLTLYKPTSANLADALDILYTDSTESTLEQIVESCKKWWYKPDQYCISLMLSPVNVTTSVSKNIKFGKYDSQVLSPYVTSQYHAVDCGTIDVPLKFGSFVDFEPHAKCKLYLPYIGFRSISANEVVGSQIAIKYHVDILTGSSLCMVRIKKEGSNNSILYTYECNTSVQVPLTSNNYGQVISGLMQASMAAASGNSATAVKDAIGAVASTGAPDVTQSGQLTSNSGVLSYPTPYLCIQFPVPTTPANYNFEKGRPSNVYMNLRGCSGMTIISDLHLDIPGAYAEEIEDIRSAFRRGVIM